MKIEIVIRLDVIGFHRFPAHDGFLANEHRHTFNIAIHIPVNHDNRDIEFIGAKSRLLLVIPKYFDKQYSSIEFSTYGVNFQDKSCESIAKSIYDIARIHLEATPSKIEVYEDNENGAIVYFD